MKPSTFFIILVIALALQWLGRAFADPTPTPTPAPTPQAVRSLSVFADGSLAAPANFFSINSPSVVAALEAEAITWTGAHVFQGAVSLTEPITFAQVNIGTEDFGWTYNPAGGGQIELRFPGGTAAFFETGSPLRPWMYFPGTIQADYIIGAGEFTSLNASALTGGIPMGVMTSSMPSPMVYWIDSQDYAGANGIPYLETGPLSAIEPTPGDTWYFPLAWVVDDDEVGNQLEGKYRTREETAAILNAPMLDAANNTFAGDVDVEGQLTSAGSTDASDPDHLLNVGAMDGRMWSVQNRHGFGALGPVTTAIGPFGNVGRPDQAFAVSWQSNVVPTWFQPFFIPPGKSVQTVTIDHLAGTHPTATLEVAIFLPDENAGPGEFIAKTSFALTATGVKSSNFPSPVTASGLVWVGIKPSMGATDFAAGGNGDIFSMRGYSANFNPWLAHMFGYGVAGQIQNFWGTMNPVGGATTGPIPEAAVPWTLQQNANGSGFFLTLH